MFNRLKNWLKNRWINVKIQYYEWELKRLHEAYHETFISELEEARDTQMLPKITRKIAHRFNRVLEKRNRYEPPSNWKPFSTP